MTVLLFPVDSAPFSPLEVTALLEHGSSFESRLSYKSSGNQSQSVIPNGSAWGVILV